MSSWGSYPSIFNVGHKAMAPLVGEVVNAEEKIDGSQFSWGLIDGELRARSKGKELDPYRPAEKLFELACQTVVRLAPELTPGWTYRGEFLAKPRHNHLTYSRVPASHLIVFDVNRDEQDYLSYDEKKAEAERLGLECVPLLWTGTWTSADQLSVLLSQESQLGGPTIEGVVIKPVSGNVWGLDHKLLMAKFVSEVFKEEQKKTWRSSNPTTADIVDLIASMFSTEARWRKAVQHLRENGELESSPRDIGKLIQEVPMDIMSDARDEIADRLFSHFWPQIRRKAVCGLPEWYKRELLENLFTSEDGHAE